MANHSLSLPAAAQVNQWQQSFIKLNQARLQAARSLMMPRQQQVLDLLPMLLHINHVRLPGFIDYRVPAGIVYYEPSEITLTALQAMARGIQVHRGQGRPPILGLYLIGSIGSVAQSRASDLDLWLCYSEELMHDELKALTKKCQKLEEWAAEMGVELHIFLMNLSALRQGKANQAQGEDSGSTQHLLLLDEFYRSSVHLAGAMPRWWLIPNEQEPFAEHYWQELVSQHLVDDEQWLHLGDMPFIPAEEFVGAGLWQLNKGLNSPYKSLLKLLLTCHYAGQYPHSRPLCWDLREQVQQGNLDRDDNDAYLLLLKRISHQLQQEENTERLALVRRAFYYKLKLPLSELTTSQKNSWRTEVVQKLVQSWGWDEHYCYLLDQRPNWDALHVFQERNALINEMLISYRYLVNFSQKHVAKLHISRQDLQSLGNRLYAAFDGRPGKIVNINPGISASLAQETITLSLVDEIWQLTPGFWPQYSNQTTSVLKQSTSLIELLCFARLNAIVTDQTRVFLADGKTLSTYELKQVQQVVNSIVSPQLNTKAFMNQARPLSWNVLVNVGIDPQLHLSRKGMQKISSRDDALGFSAIRENLVLTIDLITVNSWGEWQVERFVGDDSLVKTLLVFLQYLPKAKENGWPIIQVDCYCNSRASAIAKRVDEAVQDVLDHFIHNIRSPYLLEISENYYLLTATNQGMELSVANGTQKLLQLLQKKLTKYTPYTLDRTALLSSPLRLIFERSKAGVWQIFYWRKDGRLYFYFLDEKGALLHQQWNEEGGESSVQYWLLPLLRFLTQLDQRWQREQQRVQERKILLYELKRKPLSYHFDIARKKIPDMHSVSLGIDVRAVLNNAQQPTIYLNGQEFSAVLQGEDFYSLIRSTVRTLRQSHGNYPLFLSDLELPDNDSVIDHLQVRQRLEARLSQIG